MSKKEQDNIDEVIYEDEEVSSKVDSKLKKVKKELKNCQEEKQKYLDGWQRSQAEFVNYKKRVEEEKKVLRNYAVEDFILELIPSIDNFEMAFKDQEAWNAAPENWRAGIEYIYNQLVAVLENHSVKAINPLGEEFNPELHHSVELIEVEDEAQDGIVIEVVQKGYMLKDKNIRAAGVKVGKIKQ